MHQASTCFRNDIGKYYTAAIHAQQALQRIGDWYRENEIMKIPAGLPLN